MHFAVFQEIDKFFICIIPTNNIDEAVGVLGGEKKDYVDGEHRILLPRILFIGSGSHNSGNVSYDVGGIHFEAPNHSEGLMLRLKLVQVLPLPEVKDPSGY
jgi:hypothetical protein